MFYHQFVHPCLRSILVPPLPRPQPTHNIRNTESRVGPKPSLPARTPSRRSPLASNVSPVATLRTYTHREPRRGSAAGRQATSLACVRARSPSPPALARRAPCRPPPPLARLRRAHAAASPPRLLGRRPIRRRLLRRRLLRRSLLRPSLLRPSLLRRSLHLRLEAGHLRLG